MKRRFRTFAAIGALLIAVSTPAAAFAQKPGGILRIPHGDSPASMSTHEEATRSTATPMMGVFNNLVIFDQHVPHNTLSSIVQDAGRLPRNRWFESGSLRRRVLSLR